ncbi:MAG: hypothetical protein U0231_01185 [Nitrospiraceae bacterium]
MHADSRSGAPPAPARGATGFCALSAFGVLCRRAVLIPAGIEFARNLLVTSNKNYGGKYSEDMNRADGVSQHALCGDGVAHGHPPAALVLPTMLMQQQQAMMNAQASGQQGGGMGMGMGYPDPYNPAGRHGGWLWNVVMMAG